MCDEHLDLHGLLHICRWADVASHGKIYTVSTRLFAMKGYPWVDSLPNVALTPAPPLPFRSCLRMISLAMKPTTWAKPFL